MSIAPGASSLEFRTLRYTSLVSAVFAFANVVWGGIVRINGAGMTCPDWPRCRGVWFPSLNDTVALEWTHRFFAPILTLLIVATFVAAWRARRESPLAWKASWISLGLLAVQVVVGGLTILYKNNPPSVAAHLGLGILTFVSLLMVWYVAENAPEGRADASAGALAFSRLALSTAIVTFVAILAAGYMSASNAGLACIHFPLCSGWGEAQTTAQQIHMAHRLFAYLSYFAIVALVVAVAFNQSTPKDAVRFTWLALALGTLQIGLGVSTVISGLEPALRSLHQANGALLFASLVLLTYAAYTSAPETSPATAAHERLAPRQPT